jgi:hypothetical protein
MVHVLWSLNDVYHLNDHNYVIVRTIQNRESICGHSNVVCALKRKGFIDQVLALLSTYTLRVQDRPQVPKIPSQSAIPEADTCWGVRIAREDSL